MKYIVKFLMCVTVIFSLCGCQEDPDAEFFENAEVIEQYENENLKFDSYDDILDAYKLNESRKKELLTQMLELFLASDPSELCHEAYATYFGNIGRELMKEYNTFKSIKYSGKGSSDLSHHIENYRDYFNNNKACHMVANLLLKIEKNLKSEKYKQVLDDLNKLYEYIDEFKEVGADNE